MKLRHYILGIIILFLDQFTKILVINKKISIISNFLEFNYTENVAGAFGIGTRHMVLLLSIIIIIGLITFIIKEKKNIKYYTPFILILSGSLGNLIDRIFRGYVIDFIDINVLNFPNFNISDICITSGMMLLLIYYCKKTTKDA